jgi:hypothetical protein
MALQQFRLQFVFQRRNLATYGGMVKSKAFRGGEQLTAARYGKEYPHPVPFHLRNAIFCTFEAQHCRLVCIGAYGKVRWKRHLIAGRRAGGMAFDFP